MIIKYSKHLEDRLALRKIDRELPERIFIEAEEIYLDAKTGHSIAVLTTELYGKKKEVMVA